MNLAAKRYRIPCRCSAAVIVGPGQAGGRTVCPACGAGVDVPRLRDLEAFAADLAAANAPRPWQPCHAWLLAGAAVAILSAAAATLVGTRALARPARLPDPEMIRRAIDAADAATIHKAWQGMRLSAVDRGALPEEARLQRVAGMATRVGGLLWLLSGLGAAIAAGAGIACLARSRPRVSEVAAAAPDPGPGGGFRA